MLLCTISFDFFLVWFGPAFLCSAVLYHVHTYIFFIFYILTVLNSKVKYPIIPCRARVKCPTFSTMSKTGNVSKVQIHSSEHFVVGELRQIIFFCIVGFEVFLRWGLAGGATAW